MTAVRKVADLTEDELRALIRSELERAEPERPKPVDDKNPATVRRRPPAEAYEYVRRLRRRKGLDE